MVKLSRDPVQKGAPVEWDLTAAFAAVPAQEQVLLLKQLGAEGMARRLQILEQAGVLR